MGGDPLLKALNNWTSNYEKVLCALKTAHIRSFYICFKQVMFLQLTNPYHKNDCLDKLVSALYEPSVLKSKVKKSFFTL